MLSVQNISRTYDVTALKPISFNLQEGEHVALVGSSGSGKTTLLNILGLLDKPSSGTIKLNSVSYEDLAESERTHIRRELIGFIFQFHNLLPELSVVDNVAIPLIINGVPVKEAREQAHVWLERLRISHRAQHEPKKLSGGEQQRVAIARALIKKPSLILADEPTGNLDPETALIVFEALVEQTKDTPTMLIMATHNLALAERLNRIIRL